jgi:hypothetical protein
MRSTGMAMLHGPAERGKAFTACVVQSHSLCRVHANAMLYYSHFN